ncbi:hypothetical protein [Penaeicola halotolerans]|nr:hypothetical protein [Penaeicola halotolerans]
MELFILIAILILGGAIIIILKNGINEIIKGLESVNEKLRKIEEKLDK